MLGSPSRAPVAPVETTMRRWDAPRIVASTAAGLRVVPEAASGDHCHAQQVDVDAPRSMRITAGIAAVATGLVVIASGVAGVVFDQRFHAAGRDDLRALT